MSRAAALAGHAFRSSELEPDPEACRYRIQEPVPLQEARVQGRALGSRDGLVVVAVEDLVDRIAGLPQRQGLAVQAAERPQPRLLVEDIDDVEVDLQRFGFIRERVEALHQREVRLSPGRVPPVAAAVVNHDVHVLQIDNPGDRRSAHGAEEAANFEVPRRDVGPIHLELVGPVGTQRAIDQAPFGVIVEELEIEVPIDVRTQAAVLVGTAQARIQAAKPRIYVRDICKPPVAEGLPQPDFQRVVGPFRLGLIYNPNQSNQLCL